MILKKYNKIISSNVGDARALLSHNGNSDNVIQLSIDHDIEYDFNNILNNYNKNKKLFESNKDFSNVFRVNKVNPYEIEKKEKENILLNLNEEEKQKTPIITVSTKKILNTIAVSRVFGDYNLNVRYMKDMNVRPLLSSIPYVQLIDLNDYQIKFNDLLLLSCDGPYDVMKNNQVIENIQKYIYEDKNINNFESLTIDILDESCVKLGKLAHEKGTIDDISVFVIPLYQFENQKQ